MKARRERLQCCSCYYSLPPPTLPKPRLYLYKDPELEEDAFAEVRGPTYICKTRPRLWTVKHLHMLDEEHPSVKDMSQKDMNAMVFDPASDYFRDEACETKDLYLKPKAENGWHEGLRMGDAILVFVKDAWWKATFETTFRKRATPGSDGLMVKYRFRGKLQKVELSKCLPGGLKSVQP